MGQSSKSKKATDHSDQRATKRPPVPASGLLWRWLWPLVLIVTVVVAFQPALRSTKQFTNWDDNQYVTEQPLVKELSGQSISQMFDTGTQVASNYHPITMLSLAVDYKLHGDDASGFALTNLLLHIINTLLVFVFVRRLLPNATFVAGFTALLFGIHPMHVESVAWISERKDVLYTLFLLVSLIFYVRYVRERSMLHFAIAMAAFVLSVLSKAMATPLPILLLVVDYYLRRQIDKRAVLEKLPMLAFSVVMGLIAVKFQSEEAITKADPYSFTQRIAFAGFGYVTYWFKMLVPHNLSAWYPYPVLEQGALPIWYYGYPVLALGMVVGPVYAARRNPDLQRLIVLCIGIFVLFVAMVLQLVSVGQVVMAERYTYVPYIGSLLLLAYGASWIKDRYPAAGWALAIGFAGMCLVVTRAQAAVWENSETLWSKVIALHGSASEIAYESRALNYYLLGDKARAFQDLQVLEQRGVVRWRTYQLLGILYGERGQLEKSLMILNKADSLNPNHPRILLNRAVTKSNLRESTGALRDYKASYARLLEENGAPNTESIYSAAYGAAVESLKTNNPATAVTYSQYAIQVRPTKPEPYITLGIANSILGQHREAITNLEKARSLGSTLPLINQYLQKSYAAIGK
jgi:tetratricopeptide (TPR) repeat protein